MSYNTEIIELWKNKRRNLIIDFFKKVSEALPNAYMKQTINEDANKIYQFLDGIIEINGKTIALRFSTSKYKVGASIENKFWKAKRKAEGKFKTDSQIMNPMFFLPNNFVADFYVYPVFNIEKPHPLQKGNNYIGDFEECIAHICEIYENEKKPRGIRSDY